MGSPSVFFLFASFIVVIAASSLVLAADPAKSSSSSSSNNTSFTNMDVLDYLRSGALVVAFVATAFSGRESWFLTDMICMGAGSIAFMFFPHHLLGYVTVGTLDPMHIYGAQIWACFGFSQLVMSYRSHKSNDPQVYSSIFLTRAIGGALLLQNAACSYMATQGDKQHFSIQAVTFGWLAHLLMTIGHFIQVFKTPTLNPSSISISCGINMHLFIDGLLFTIMSFFYYGFPNILLGLCQLKGFTADGIHTYLFRTLGALAFSQAMHAFGSLHFRNDEDKRAHLAGRIALYAIFVPVILLTQWQHSFVRNQDMYLALGFTALITGNALLGYLPKMSLARLKSK